VCWAALFEFASRTPVLIGTFATASVLLVVVFPALPLGGQLLDATLGYTHDEVMAAMSGYGADGRRVYALASLTADTLLPVAYVGFLAGLVFRLRPGEGHGVLAYLPVAAGGLDLCENAQIVAMLVGFPEITPGQVAAASLFTQLKHGALLASVCLAATLVVIALVRRTKRLGKRG